jgi:hypothetical protein
MSDYPTTPLASLLASLPASLLTLPHPFTIPFPPLTHRHAQAVRSHSVNPTATVKKVINTAFQEHRERGEGGAELGGEGRDRVGGGGLDFLMIVGDSHLNPQDLPSLGNGRVYTCALGRKIAKKK